MRLVSATWVSGLLALVLVAQFGHAQTAPLTTATESALHTMSRQAAIIFAGQVTAVRLTRRNRIRLDPTQPEL
jgi:hypothetical protein